MVFVNHGLESSSRDTWNEQSAPHAVPAMVASAASILGALFGSILCAPVFTLQPPHLSSLLAETFTASAVRPRDSLKPRCFHHGLADLPPAARTVITPAPRSWVKG